MQNCAGLPGSTLQHTLLLQLDGMTGAVQTAELQPGDMDIKDVEQAATSGQQGPSFVVCSLLDVHSGAQGPARSWQQA